MIVERYCNCPYLKKPMVEKSLYDDCRDEYETVCTNLQANLEIAIKALERITKQQDGCEDYTAEQALILIRPAAQEAVEVKI